MSAPPGSGEERARDAARQHAEEGAAQAAEQLATAREQTDEARKRSWVSRRFIRENHLGELFAQALGL